MLSTTVKASVLHGVRDLRVEERSLPPLSDTQVEVAIKSTGLCGSDLHYFNHFRNGDILVREPLTLGHESAGVVTAVGAGNIELKVGDRVALEVGQPCQTCQLCQEGRYNLCRDMAFRSSARIFPHAQGTLQERVIAPARFCFKLPDAVSYELGALAEPLCVALHARDRASLPKGSTVLVLGAGAVGLLVAAVAKASGAKAVVIADIQEDRVRFATDNKFADAGFVVPMKRPEGIDAKLEFAKEVAEMAKNVQVGSGELLGEVRATFECTGVESCLQTAIYATQPGGKIMLIGMGTPIQTLPISAAALREVDLVGVFRYAHNYKDALTLLASNDPNLAPLKKLVTQTYNGMDSIPRAFEMAGKVKDDDGNLVLKVMVNM